MASVTGFARSLLMLPLVGVAMVATAPLAGCDETDPVSASVIPVKIAGKTFHLEVAADFDKRMRGLGGRTTIEDTGGMIFTFPPSQIRVQEFVMRDCPIDIDILYLDAAGRVLTTYTMKAEPRNKDGSDGQDGDMTSEAGRKYDERLKRYSSRFPSHFVVELQAGSIQKLGVKEGDQLGFDVAALKRRAR